MNNLIYEQYHINCIHQIKKYIIPLKKTKVDLSISFMDLYRKIADQIMYLYNYYIEII